MNDSLFKEHIKLVEAVNSSKDERQHQYNEAILIGFRTALRMLDVNQIIDVDYYYINKGIDRPMCGGVFLDWAPEV